MGSAMTVATEVKRAAATAKSFIVVGRLVERGGKLLLMESEDASRALLNIFLRASCDFESSTNKGDRHTCSQTR